MSDPLVLGAAPSGDFARLATCIEKELGQKLTAWNRIGDAPILVADEVMAGAVDWPAGRSIVWVESTRRIGAIGGKVRIAKVGSERVLDHDFDAIAPSRPWLRGEAFVSVAARRVLEVACRDGSAPWPALDHADRAGRIPLWRSAFESRSWGLAGFGFDDEIRWRHGEIGFTLADPFPIVHQGREWIFFEEQRSGSPGVLSAGVFEDGKLTEIAHNVLPSPTHRSWPNTFEHGGDLWMIPESGEDREVALWRCSRFPDSWDKTRVLLTGASWTDPVLFRHDKNWWLFVSRSGSSPLAHSDSLHLFHSPDPWKQGFTAHPWNPVSIGVVGSRPAGRILSENGRLVRPAQDCSHHYGRGLVFREIEELSPVAYRETSIRRLSQPVGTWGIHTWNRMESGVVVDLLEGRSRLGALLTRF